MHYRILQIKDIENSPYVFRSYESAKRHGFKLDDYEVIYEGEVDSDINLDYFFEWFNIDRPDDFCGHSLSVSDIVELEGHYYYCDSIGWAEIEQISK